MNTVTANVVLSCTSLLTVLFCLWPIAGDLLRRRLDVFNPRHFFLLYYALQLGLYPILILAAGDDFRFLSRFNRSDMEWMVKASAVSCLGIICFNLGYFLYPKFPRLRRKPPPKAGSFSRFNPRAVASVAYLSVPVVAFAIYRIYFAAGGLSGYMDSFVELRYGGISHGYLYFFSVGFVSIIGVLMFIVSVRREDGAGRLGKFVALILFVLAAISALLTGFRTLLVPVVFMAGASYNYCVRRISPLGAVIFCLSFFAFLSVYGVIRTQVESLSGAPSEEMNAIQSAVMRSPGTEMVAITMRDTAGGEPYAKLYGAAFEAATLLIPRALWPNKPLPQSFVWGDRFMQYYLYLRDGKVTDNTGGNSMTIVGYLYWQWGIGCVLIGMFILGGFFRWYYDLYIYGRDSEVRTFLYIVISSVFTKFAEAPQDTVNAVVVLFAFSAILVVLCRQYLHGGSAQQQLSRTWPPRHGVSSR